MHEDWLVELNSRQYIHQLLVLHCLEMHNFLINLEYFTKWIVLSSLDSAGSVLRGMALFRLFLYVDAAVPDVATLDRSWSSQGLVQL